jgi:hypothetical protein
MTIHYAKFHGKTVSKKWWVVLTHMEQSGVIFTLNSGHRTMREQALLFKQNMHLVNGHWVPRPDRPRTAFPSPVAPHIRVGRADHALDLGMPGNVERHLRYHGAHPTFPVSGESWHLELPNDELTRLWRELA